MRPNIPFPSRGGDYRFDVKTGQLVDVSAQPAEQPPTPERPAKPAPAIKSTRTRSQRGK